MQDELTETPPAAVASVANMRKYQGLPGGTIIAWSSLTGEAYSAHPGDYWSFPDDYTLTDSEGFEMVLVRRVTTYEPVTG